MPRPFVDDTYRADNRWGPRPRYNEQITLPADPNRYGEIITSADLTPFDPPVSLARLTANTPVPDSEDDFGLDGYWERRAVQEGLRLIVGQRLELGNRYGWDGTDRDNPQFQDPLYPYIQRGMNSPFDNITLQRRTLRDNLAAVQATAVYHYQVDNGNFPAAVLASTAHVGNETVWDDSTTFNLVDYIPPPAGQLNVDTDFFTGNGTNGWEFDPPMETQAAFATAIDDPNSDLRKALNNLAHFAGDPEGAFPPTQEQGADQPTHPYPYFTMWGDFSELRRIIDQRIGLGYNNLSIAEQSTLHTAAADLGLLAYNIANKERVLNVIPADDDAEIIQMRELGHNLWLLVDGNFGNYEIVDNSGTIMATDTDPGTTPDAMYYQSFTSQEYLEALQHLNSISPPTSADYIDLTDSIDYMQRRIEDSSIETALHIERDRTLGFIQDPVAPPVNEVRSPEAPYPNIGVDLDWDRSTGDVMDINLRPLRTKCDPEYFQPVFTAVDGTTLSASPEQQEGQIGLAMAFCGEASNLDKPLYPALYYLFPAEQHDHVGNTSVTGVTAQPQPVDNREQYVRIIDGTSNYVEDANDIPTRYEYNSFDIANIANIALQPRLPNNWILPNSLTAMDDPTNVGNNQSLITVENPGSTPTAPTFTIYYLSLLDKAFYDGREAMQVRTLDINLDLLRSNTVTAAGDFWLPSSGVVYAFREDAVREDAIARPRSAACGLWDATTTINQLDAVIVNDNCRMNIMTDYLAPTPDNGQDPPLNTTNNISPKPVDYFPDPDRRPPWFQT